MKFFNKLLISSVVAIPSFASASSLGPVMQVHVPFSFTVGAQQFTAGDYRIQENENGVIYVQGQGKAAATLSSPADVKSGPSSSLYFTSAEQHYLTRVQVLGESSRSIPSPAQNQRKLTLSSAR